MTYQEHISSTSSGAALLESMDILNSQILQCSVFCVQCSVFPQLQRSLIGVPCSVFPHTVSPITTESGYPELSENVWLMLERSFSDCLDLYTDYIGYTPQLESVQESASQNNPEDNWYIYHSDHLGSSSFLTDANGDPTKILTPLSLRRGGGGEVHRTIEQRATTDYYTPYTFSAKERDLETGYSYFGARYYDPNVSVWLSVDPLSDKYPSMSAFMYCAGNPVILVDPDGSFIVGSDNKAISYSGEASGKILWSPNTTKDVQLIGELLLSTNIGTQLFEAAMTAKYPISIVISEELVHEKLGVCAPDLVLERGKAGPTMKRADITIFKGSIIQLWYDLMVSDCILDGSEGSLVQSNPSVNHIL